MVTLLTGTLVAPCTAGAAPASVPSASAAGTPRPSPSGPDVRPLPRRDTSTSTRPYGG
ncbi:hypothetical protein LT493_41895 [Streptomyces tricolor]|nr:hypothetical protein [Streptomyces tricolor]